MLISVLLIISDQRFSFEKKLKNKYRIEREWWIPPLFLIFAILIGIVSSNEIYSSFQSDFEIIIFIFTLALVSQGLEKSDFFKYFAYKFVRKSNGNIVRLMIYMFVFTSSVTLFTSNDIVILILTPILIEIGFRIKLENMIPLLLPQFIIANTISMGILIGSPTNIIIAENVSLNFFSYFVLMIIPTLISFFVIFLIFYLFLRFSNKSNNTILSKFQIDRQSYNVDGQSIYFTNEMRGWISIFVTMVISVSIVTYFDLTLLLCSIPIIIISVIYWKISEEEEDKYTIQKSIKKLPYGVLFFGMSFFILAEAFSTTEVFRFATSTISEVENPVGLITSGVVGSGILVNLFNDLPASALVAQMLVELEFSSRPLEIVTYQSVLVGMNYPTLLRSSCGLAR